MDLTFLSILRELVIEEGSRVLFTFRNVLVFGGCNITVKVSLVDVIVVKRRK